jgi:DNA transformation protein and related proteins
MSDNYRAFILEQLAKVLPEVRGRSMFGGVGIYSATMFFALIGDDVLYFKVDDQTRPDFEAKGMQPFRPFGEHGEVMQYYEVPPEVIEDLDALRQWADEAVGVARRARARKLKKSR